MTGGASLRTLRAFLRDERVAAARYRRALPQFAGAAETDELNACLASHERRIETLEGRIREMGEEPEAIADGDEDEDQDDHEDGTSKIVQRLEDGEDRALKHYLDDVCKLDADTRRLIAREVLPEQVRTYDWVADLRLSHAG